MSSTCATEDRILHIKSISDEYMYKDLETDFLNKYTKGQTYFFNLTLHSYKLSLTRSTEYIPVKRKQVTFTHQPSSSELFN